MREYLEKHYAETSGKETIKLALKSLMETVEAGSKNVEVRPRGQHTFGGAATTLSDAHTLGEALVLHVEVRMRAQHTVGGTAATLSAAYKHVEVRLRAQHTVGGTAATLNAAHKICGGETEGSTHCWWHCSLTECCPHNG